MRSYNLFGLVVLSEFEVPELSLATTDECVSSPLAIIKRGPVPATILGGVKVAHWIEVSPSECLFTIDKEFRILVSGGDRIIVEILSEEISPRLTAYLVGCGFITLAHQRKLIPLHVGAVKTDAGILLLSGASGHGKSTLSTALDFENKWPILCDDIAVLDMGDVPPRDGGAEIHFSVNQAKLWLDAAKQLGLDPAMLNRDHFRPTKFHVPITPQVSVSFKHIGAVCSLEWDNNLKESSGILVKRMSKLQIFTALMNSIHSPFLVNIFNDINRIRAACLTMANSVVGISVVRNKDAARVEDVCAILKKESKKW